jgi:hexosaminidase
MKKTFLTILMAVATLAATAQEANYNVVPLPQNITLNNSKPFVLNNQTSITAEGNEAMQRNAKFLKDYIKQTTGLQVADAATKGSNSIVLRLSKKISANEGYCIKVDAKKVVIEGKTPAGVFYGIQTLRKSLPVNKHCGKHAHHAMTSISMPAGVINDQPRFGYRGGMLDVARHFFPVAFVKEYIDLLALHNLNTFHFHLTEDQGWRIEIKKYPKLTEIGSKRAQTVVGHNSPVYDETPYGPFFYTQEELREIVKYAADRYITVIPEIDMPGHMRAALAAYPEFGCTGGPYTVAEEWGVFDEILCAGKEETCSFLQDILDEILDIFPSKVIHIGGDEAPRTEWKKCPRCQKRIEEQNLQGRNGFSKEAQLQCYFMNRISKYLASKGRTVIGWDELLEGDVDPGTTIMSWRGTEGGEQAAARGLNAVMAPTPYHYFDHYQNKDQSIRLIGGYIPIEKVYSYNPVPDDASVEMKKHIIGVQANLWTEYITCSQLAEYQLLPRMAAMCETAWSDNSKKDFNSFREREKKLTKLYDKFKWTYAKDMWKQEK